MKWGCVARGANVGDIVKQLQCSTSRGVLIVGSRGAGKTWMLGQILAELGTGVMTIRLTASKALAAVPFGAVNARIGANLIRSNDYYDVLNGLLDQIDAAVESSHRVFLMVDNAEHLDSQSAAIVLQVVMSSPAKLILVEQPGSHHTLLRDLWRDGHLTRYELAPLKSEDVRTFLEGLLGGKVAGPAADYLAVRSAGNPLVLHGLVVGAQEEGSLRKANNVWVLDHPADRLGTESREFLQMDLEHLPADSRRIIEILALAGPLPLDALLDLTCPEAIDDIQRRDLVEIFPGPHMTMRLARQATAPAIRAMVPMGRSRRFFADVVKILPTEDPSNPETIMNFTRWALDCGMPVSEERILEATIWANQLMRPLEALQFSSNKVTNEISATLLAERAVAHLNQKSPEEARTLAMQALELAATPEAAASALRAVHLCHSSELDYEQRFNEALARYESRFGPVVLGESSTSADIAVMITLAIKDVSLGDTERASRTIQTLLSHPLTTNVGDRVHLKSLQSEILTAIGQMSGAVALAVDVISELESPAGFPRPDIAILAYTRCVSAFVHDGAWEHVRAALEPSAFVNPDLLLYSGGQRDLATGLMQCRRGYIEEALAALESAVGSLKDYDPWSMLHTALGLQAYCLIMGGDLPASQASLVQLAALNRRSGKFYELEGSAYAAAAQFMTGKTELGMARLRGLERECRAHGYLGIELTVLSLMVRLGDSAAVDRLSEVAGQLESSSKEFYVEWAAAMCSQDPETLDRASATAMSFGFELQAVEFATHTLNKFHATGKMLTSRNTASKLVAMREQMPGLVSPVSRPMDQPRMTRREHEIALLVAQGESNNSIAARLHLSLRTIEGHLYRTFIKMDIQSREQLAAVMNGDTTQESVDAQYSQVEN
ncbi:LuxR C-terminal-related transcriptional regulator [Arthrobacter sp. LAPM80]|uniref:LuxR C-terminal-related transcriptional regulator n=1 Tax=Arthrobacter sp. LAPM80 TaxID=3141788 RepID=UPI00398A75BE